MIADTIPFTALFGILVGAIEDNIGCTIHSSYEQPWQPIQAVACVHGRNTSCCDGNVGTVQPGVCFNDARFSCCQSDYQGVLCSKGTTCCVEPGEWMEGACCTENELCDAGFSQSNRNTCVTKASMEVAGLGDIEMKSCDGSFPAYHVGTGNKRTVIDKLSSKVVYWAVQAGTTLACHEANACPGCFYISISPGKPNGWLEMNLGRSNGTSLQDSVAGFTLTTVTKQQNSRRPKAIQISCNKKTCDGGHVTGFASFLSVDCPRETVV
eukprot:TRINITY_DN8718_c0_g1_i1.p1 TRINITY_DN8718_c0_g1~~TRINITY_DN8718_c0_g1_i1.p1  ORF type:complete len:267 (-),score=32.23 TRINITY_DN8718_c0_g1_i1:142-942(-)